MKRVLLESPFKGSSANVRYAQLCLLDSLRRGEAPLASHLLYTQVLDDDNIADRATGISAGHFWLPYADALVVYTDLGLSTGMTMAIEYAQRLGVMVYYRSLFDENNPYAVYPVVTWGNREAVGLQWLRLLRNSRGLTSDPNPTGQYNTPDLRVLEEPSGTSPGDEHEGSEDR